MIHIFTMLPHFLHLLLLMSAVTCGQDGPVQTALSSSVLDSNTGGDLPRAQPQTGARAGSPKATHGKCEQITIPLCTNIEVEFRLELCTFLVILNKDLDVHELQFLLALAESGNR